MRDIIATTIQSIDALARLHTVNIRAGKISMLIIGNAEKARVPVESSTSSVEGNRNRVVRRRNRR